ncbi:MAG: 30S ribosomal protein S6 [Candidatus Harrisonbacteria bacterium]|nr:30S ribosomal protein S6 [Candidatus Harrisonbacteria bacterium]
MLDDSQSDDTKEYELAFVLANEEAAEVEKILAAHGASVTGKGPLAAVKLAYPLQKHASGYFGYCRFRAYPAEVKAVKDALAVQPNVLRSLLSTPPVKSQGRDSREVHLRAAQQKPIAEVVAKETPPAAHVIPEVLSNELLEKKLEEILK